MVWKSPFERLKFIWKSALETTYRSSDTVYINVFHCIISATKCMIPCVLGSVWVHACTIFTGMFVSQELAFLPGSYKYKMEVSFDSHWYGNVCASTSNHNWETSRMVHQCQMTSNDHYNRSILSINHKHWLTMKKWKTRITPLKKTRITYDNH